MMQNMETLHQRQQTVTGEMSLALRPCIAATGRHAEHAAHEPQCAISGMLLDSVKPHLGTSAKMATDFYGCPAPSGRDRARAAGAQTLAPDRLAMAEPSTHQADGGATPRAIALQLCGVEGEPYGGRDLDPQRLLSRSTTTFRVISGVSYRLSFVIKHLSAPVEAH